MNPDWIHGLVGETEMARKEDFFLLILIFQKYLSVMWTNFLARTNMYILQFGKYAEWIRGVVDETDGRL